MLETKRIHISVYKSIKKESIQELFGACEVLYNSSEGYFAIWVFTTCLNPRLFLYLALDF
jgi:hypothetical protein